MNTLLTKHVPLEEGKNRAESIQAYEKAWEASKYLLAPLAAMLVERKKTLGLVSDQDFSIINHYGRVMFHKGKETEIDLLLSMLPKTLTE